MVRFSTFSLLAITFLLAGCDALGPQGQLDAFVKKEKANLPKQVDEFTTLVGLESKPLEIVYTYDINGLTDEQITENKALLEQTVRDALQSSKEKLKMQIEQKIKMTYVYKGPSQTELFRFTVETWKL